MNLLVNINYRWGTHLPLLMKAVNLTEGSILECGAGMSSTPFLHFACIDTKRRLVSYESDREFFKRYVYQFKSDFHEVHWLKESVRSWNSLDLSEHWSVALIDQHPCEARKETIKRLAHNCDYIIVHDTQGRMNYKYHFDEVYPMFKYRKDWDKLRPFTTVLSNFKDLSNL